jgi:2-polyprenyl-3-methyl-5-hydroxy-6-metoxy-1,4-benzoquinol methylase
MPPAQRALTSPDDWEQQGQGRPLVKPMSDFPDLLDRHLPKRTDWSVIEIGACPGSQLLAIALSHGYRPVALDYLPEVRHLPQAFASFGIEGLEVIEQDFLTFRTTRRFDVVTSYGFIEHFSDPVDIIRRHWDLVADGGFLVLGTPVFGPLQLALRRRILKPGELERIMRMHNTRIMSVEAIADICRGLPAARIEAAAYAGRMGAWFSSRDSGVRRGRAWLLVLWRAAGLVPRLLNWSSRRFSPLGLVIVRRGGL